MSHRRAKQIRKMLKSETDLDVSVLKQVNVKNKRLVLANGQVLEYTTSTLIYPVQSYRAVYKQFKAFARA